MKLSRDLMQPKIGKSELDQLREEVDNQICHIQVASHDEEVFEYALQQVLVHASQIYVDYQT